MIFVKNKEKRVLIFKSAKANPLRLLPGMNKIELKNLDVYTKGNKAASAIAKASLKIYDAKSLSAEQKKEASDAKKKNDKLNKDADLLKAAQNRLAEMVEKDEKSSTTIADLQEQIQALTDRLAKVDEISSPKDEDKTDSKDGSKK